MNQRTQGIAGAVAGEAIRKVELFRQQHANFAAYFEAWKAEPTYRNTINTAHSMGSFLVAAQGVETVAHDHGNITVLRELDSAMDYYRKCWKEMTAAGVNIVWQPGAFGQQEGQSS